MISSLAQSPASGLLRPRPPLLRPPPLPLSVLLPISAAAPTSKGCNFSLISLHPSSAKGFLTPRGAARHCSAGNDSGSTPVAAEDSSATAAENSVMFLYAVILALLTALVTLTTKRLLNAFPYPWLVSAVSLATGCLFMFASWAAGSYEAPKTDIHFWKCLFPVAVAHTIGLVAAMVSMSKMAVSFVHIVRCGEPVFSVLLAGFLVGESVPLPLGLSILPIIVGCAIAAFTELNFNMAGFVAAMISNLAFAVRNIIYKKGMEGKHQEVTGPNYYACLSMVSFTILAPFALAIEGPRMWGTGWQKAVSQLGPFSFCFIGLQSIIFYQWYKVDSFRFFPYNYSFTFIIGNTMNKIAAIINSIAYFQTAVQPINAVGAAIAIIGVFLYSRESCKNSRKKSWLL